MIEKNSASWNLWGKNNNVNMEINYQIKMPLTNNVNLTNDYGGINLNKLEGKTKINCDYGKLKIGDAENLNGTSDYMNLSIDKLLFSCVFNLDYGSLKIEELGLHLKELKLQSSYTHVKLGLNPNASFDITTALSYSGFKHGDHFTFNKEIEKSTSKYYEGYYNSPNSGAQISIKSSYGGISFNNN